MLEKALVKKNISEKRSTTNTVIDFITTEIPICCHTISIAQK